MEPTPQQPDVAAADRRDKRRRTTNSKVELTVETTALSGRTENLSGAGVFLFSDSPLRVSVAIEQDGETLTRSGRLVRVERMNADSTGYAIEFDAD